MGVRHGRRGARFAHDPIKIVGKPIKRVDTPKKVNGTAGFGIDVRLKGMLHASVEHCPVFGGKVASFDATKAKAIPGVKDVIQIPTGVAVIAGDPPKVVASLPTGKGACNLAVSNDGARVAIATYQNKSITILEQ